MTIRNIKVITAAASLLVMGAFSVASAESAFRVRTQLSGSAIRGLTPSGHLDFRVDGKGRRRLIVEVEKVNLAIGTTLTVHIMRAGSPLPLTSNQFMLVAHPEAGNGGELEDQSEDGDVIPDLSHGDFVIHVNVGARTLLSGALHD